MMGRTYLVIQASTRDNVYETSDYSLAAEYAAAQSKNSKEVYYIVEINAYGARDTIEVYLDGICYE